MMSVATSVTAAEAPRAGADLRAGRERLGWLLEDMAAGLKIRQSYLEALEDGRLSALPGSAYALAFVRTYARALGLDAEEAVRRFRMEAGEAAQRAELVFPAPAPERGLPAGAIMLLGLVMAIGAYAGWYRLSAEGRLPAEAPIAIPERLAPLAEQAIPPVQPAPVVADARPVQPAPFVPAEQVADTPPPAISPVSAAAALVPPQMRDVAAEQPVPVAPSVAASEEDRIVIRANAPSWLLVKDKAGAVLLNRILKSGETWTVPKDGLLLTTGNAAGTDILVNGTATPSLGAPGAVRRDLPLDIETILDGKLGAPAPQLASRPR